jgi:hypothetical protein
MSRRRTGLALGLVVGLAATLVIYYWVHKPITPVAALAVGGTLATLVVVAVLVLLGGGIGRRVLRLWLGSQDIVWFLSPGARATLEATLGWGLLALSLLGLGLARLYYSQVAWPVVVLLLIELRRDIRAWSAQLVAAVKSLAPEGRLARLAAAFTALMLAQGLLQALAPPLMWDALVYHLTLPVLYARTHGIQVNLVDFSLFSGMPQLAEMLFTAAGLLRLDPAAGSIAAQGMSWCFGALLALGLAAAAQDIGVPGWLAPAVLFSSFTLSVALAWAYADLLLMLIALAVVLALRQWHYRSSQSLPADRWLALGAVLAGLAWGCKYTGVIVPVAASAVVAVGVVSAGPGAWPSRILRGLGLAARFMLIATLVFAPWLIKNWVLTGSPVYPLLWPAADMDALRQWFYNRPDLAERGPLALLILARATFLGVQGGNNYDVTLGPLLLFLPAALAFVWRSLPAIQRRELRGPILFVAVAYAVWVLLSFYSALAQQARLFFAFLPPLALLGAAGLAGIRNLNTQALRVSLVINAAFALVLGLTAIEASAYFIDQNPLAYLTGTQSAADYRAARLGWYALAIDRVNALAPGSRVIFLWEARSLECGLPVRCLPDVVIDRWWHLRRTVGSAAQILARWRAEGATHLLIYDAGQQLIQANPNAFDPSDWTELAGLRTNLKQTAVFGGAYTLYALK